jgi:RecB family exonuclease
MQRVIARVAGTSGPDGNRTVASARTCAVLVPTRGAAEALRRTLEHLQLSDRGAIVLPDLLTREDLYDRLHRRLLEAPVLSEFEREVIFRRAALDAEAAGAPAPFRLRAGLIVQMLGFYDELRRRDRPVAAFDRLMTGSLESSAEIDRGAERLLRLTRFLTAAFRAFESRTAASGALDEHALRVRLLEREDASPYRHVIVTVPDQAADGRGLWPADYTLLAGIPGLERLDVLATEPLLAAGYLQRIHHWLPGLEEERSEIESAAPALVVPDPDPAKADRARWFVRRDREEELVEVARLLKQRSVEKTAIPLSRTAMVFQRPLPYLYLGRQVFGASRIPYQALDALPLAAEPFATAIDLVFAFIVGEATRAATIELLASANWTFEVEGRRLDRRDVMAADEYLRELKYVGGWDRLSRIADGFGPGLTGRADQQLRRSGAGRAARALSAAAAVAMELRLMTSAASASAQIATLLAFITAHERPVVPSDPWYERHSRARAAILTALASLRDAHRRFDDAPIPAAELAATVRRRIEGQTFAPMTGEEGVQLMDAPAAPYADLDDLHIVGLVERDWPEPGRRNIFYPLSLLSQLGWPAEADRLSAARAAFQDLLRLPAIRVAASTFTLEDDAIVPPSPLLEELDAWHGRIERVPPRLVPRVFEHEAIDREPMAASAVSPEAAAWLAIRTTRSPAGDERFHGAAGVREPAEYAVSRIERYLECPFKYFAAHVLNLPEERREDASLTPRERGQFVHTVFEAFFTAWHASGGRAITSANVADALRLFARIAETGLATLSEGDRALERTYLLGSAAGSGLAERAFAFEIEQGGEVIERLLEHSLEGAFEFRSPDGPRTLRLRAKADRIDLLDDGTLRVIDYKLGRAPKPSRALQLAVYGVCAQQQLDGRHGRSWRVGRAGYVAFKERQVFVPLGGSSSLDEAMAAGQARIIEAIDAIEQGRFPPAPEEPYMCTWCAYSSVCRKDYVGDE